MARRAAHNSDCLIDIFLRDEASSLRKIVTEVDERTQGFAERLADKEKATFYLPIEVLDELEALWHELRRRTRRKIKKSEIVSIAIQAVSDQFKGWQSGARASCDVIEKLDENH